MPMVPWAPRFAPLFRTSIICTSIIGTRLCTPRSVLALRPEDMTCSVYLLCGKIAPDFAGVELNVGGGTIGDAVRLC